MPDDRSGAERSSLARVVDSNSWSSSARSRRSAGGLVAVRFGKTRLIETCCFAPEAGGTRNWGIKLRIN